MTEPDLLSILDDLKPDEFERFKWSLKYETLGDIPSIKEHRLSNAERWNVVGLMVQNYELAGAVEVTKTILKKISRNDLVTRLPTIISGAEDQERVLQKKYQSSGHSQAVKESIEILEKTSLTRKELQVVEKQFKLVEDEFSREMCTHHPKVKILRGVNSVILEGPDEEVQLAETKLEELIKQLKEKRVMLSAALITFMTSSGVISKYQTRFQRSLRSPVALEVGSDLVLSSLSSAALDEAETAVLRDLSEVTVQLQGSTASSPHLDKVKEILIKAKNEANLQELRVEVSFVPDPRAAVIKVQLVGYTEHVNKLKDLLLEYQIEHSKNLHPQQADEVQKNISDKNRQMGGAERKFSIVVLGTEDHLKKSLIYVILGRDGYEQRRSDVINETYESDTYEVTFTPKLYEASGDIRLLFSARHPDMCLLVVEDGFTPSEVWHQIEKLHEITGKPTEEFTVVLPLGYKPEESYPFMFYTWDDLFNKLRKITEDRALTITKKRSAERPHTQKRMTDGSYRQDYFTRHKKSLKEMKISIVVLWTEDHLKKSLISLILGRDRYAHRSSDVIIETYSNDTYEVTFTPNLYTGSEDIRRLFSSQRDPDMCLLVVEDGFKTQEVWHQVEHLHKITGKPTKDFIVVLPLRCKPEESYPFMFYTWDDLFNKLRKLTEHRTLKLTKKRSADQSHTQMEMDAKHKKKLLADDKRSLKENHSDNKVNLVLLGRYGTGKSASGNTILGKRQFESKPSSMPITTKCQASETEINGTCVRVIDTPDIFDDEIKPSVKNHHVTQCRRLCQSDPPVYLLVMQVGRFKDGERDILRKVEEAFGRRAKEQTILLFTCGEDLQRDKMSFEDFLHSCQPELKNIVDQCDRRCVVFQNKTSRQPQVTKLMQTVYMLNKQQKQ